MTSFLSFNFVVLQVLVLTAWITLCHASSESDYDGNNKDHNVYPWGTNPNNHFKMYWKDAANVLQDLHQFSALYVRVHGCAWSECSVDNFDDDGENHDGDEDWYQTRTSNFCANAAYSLYGIRKNTFKLPFNSCSKGTYINSFFTYGGADTILDALQMEVSQADGNRFTPGDDDTYGTSNSDCVSLNGNNNNNNNNKDEHARQLDEDEEDEENDDAIYQNVNNAAVTSTTMGCAAPASSKYPRFVLAGFDDDYCNGNHFVQALDSFRSYNKAMAKINCVKVWDLGSYNRQQRSSSSSNNNNNDDANDDAVANDDGGGRQRGRKLMELSSSSSSSLPKQDEREEPEETDHDQPEEQEQDKPLVVLERHLNDNQNSNDNNYNSYRKTYASVAEQLLYHSWACDIKLYPEQCPDPYGIKRKYTNVIKAAANGQPISFAVMNAKLRKPIILLTYLFFLTGLYLAGFTYFLKNKAYMQNHGGGARGLWATLQRDIFAAHVALQEKVKAARERHQASKRNRAIAAATASARGGEGGGGSGSPRDGSGRRHKRSESGGANGGGGGIGGSSSGGLWGSIFGKSKRSKKKKRRRSSKHPSSSSQHRSRNGGGGGGGDRGEIRRTRSGRSQREEFLDEEAESASQYTEMTDEHSRSRSSRHGKSTVVLSSNRTSRAAEAAFAAAAQFDLEQQASPGGGGGGGGSSGMIHPAILPTGGDSARGRSQSSRRSRSPRHANGGSGSGGMARQSSRSLERSAGGQSLERSTVSRGRGGDPSPTRSPGGSSVRRRSSSRSRGI